MTDIESRSRDKDLPVEFIELSLHEDPGVLHCLVVDGRPQGSESEVENMLGAKAVFIQVPEEAAIASPGPSEG